MVIFREENEHQSIGLSGKSTKMDLDDNLQYVHRVHLGGLKSNRRYMYKVGNGDKYSWSWSREKSFKTLPASTTAKNVRQGLWEQLLYIIVTIHLFVAGSVSYPS